MYILDEIFTEIIKILELIYLRSLENLACPFILNTDGEIKSRFATVMLPAHLSLETTLQEVLNLEAEHVIELHAALVQHTDTHQTTQECIT